MDTFGKNKIIENNPQYHKDLQFGLSEEDRIKPILERYFGELNKLTKYEPYDFENDKYLIEIKSRRIPHNKYNSLMVNYSKIEKIDSDTKQIVFIFNCDDGIFYWYYNPTQFTIGRGGRCDRGCNEYYQMAYVSVEFIKNIIELPIMLSLDEEEEEDKADKAEQTLGKESCCQKYFSKQSILIGKQSKTIVKKEQ